MKGHRFNKTLNNFDLQCICKEGYKVSHKEVHITIKYNRRIHCVFNKYGIFRQMADKYNIPYYTDTIKVSYTGRDVVICFCTHEIYHKIHQKVKEYLNSDSD